MNSNNRSIPNPNPDDELLEALGLGSGDPFEALQKLLDPAAHYLSQKKFKEMAPSAKKSWTDSIKQISAVDINEVDSGFVVILRRQPVGEPCKGCGELHEDGTTVQMLVGMVGEPMTIAAMIDLGSRESSSRSRPSTETTTPVFVEGGVKKQ